MNEKLYSLLCDVMRGDTYDECAPVEMRAAYIALVVDSFQKAEIRSEWEKATEGMR